MQHRWTHQLVAYALVLALVGVQGLLAATTGGPVYINSAGVLTPPVPASAISNTPAGTIAATTVQAAVDELDGDIGAKAATTDPRFPTADEKAAMAGSHGTPSDTNRYLTQEGIDQPDGLAGLDGAGALNEPDTRLAEVIKFVTVEPGAGDCDFATQEIRFTDTGGEVYGFICTAVGGNPQRIDEYGDSPVQFVTQGTTVVMDGPTSVTLTGANGITTSGDNTTKTITITGTKPSHHLAFGCSDNDSATTAVYLRAGDNLTSCATSDTTQGQNFHTSRRTGSLKNLVCRSHTTATLCTNGATSVAYTADQRVSIKADQDTDSNVFTARLEQADTALTCTIAHSSADDNATLYCSVEVEY